jgi:hydroxymethylglutaryl-CoA lyase
VLITEVIPPVHCGMAEFVRITDVSPRDGLQNEAGIISTADKVELITLLAGTGVSEIEATSFVSPKWVPQLADCAEVAASLSALMPRASSVGEGNIDLTKSKTGGTGVSPVSNGPGVPHRRDACATENTDRALPIFSALVPNERGLSGVLAANQAAGRTIIRKIALFTAASETFSRRNTNAGIDDTLSRFAAVIAAAKRERLIIRAYISCVIACPFEGAISPTSVVRLAARLASMGVDEIDLGDTIGAGTPESTAALLREYLAFAPIGMFTASGAHPPAGAAIPVTLHLHDTFGRAGACVKSALDLGVRSFDGSVAGLGGCPYASTPTSRAPGNIATELLVEIIERAGFRTGVDRAALSAAATFAGEIVARSRAAAPSASTGTGAGTGAAGATS